MSQPRSQANDGLTVIPILCQQSLLLMMIMHLISMIRIFCSFTPAAAAVSVSQSDEGNQGRE